MGRPQRSAAAGPSRRSARAASTIKNERITRSSRAKHSYALDDPEQVERDLNAQLKRMGLYAANTTGDGNCLFRALSDQLYGHSARHAHLRQETCDHLAARPDKFAGFVDDKPFDQYVKLMRENGTYGGHLELHAFAQMKQKQIKIVQPGLVYVVEGVDDSPEARRLRDEKEQERLRVQSSLETRSDSAPLTERQRRKQKRDDGKRDKKQPTSAPQHDEASTSASASAETATADETASSSQPSSAAPATAPSQGSVDASPPQPAEAYGPLYIAYHNWEHYSSIRNLDGPHSGLPRIREQSIASAGAAAAASADTKILAKDPSIKAEPTTEEKMVLQSISGDHDLEEVRRLLEENHNDWAHVVEVILEKDAIIDEEEVGAELQAVPSSGEQVDGSDRLAVPPLPPLPDHMRHWRATSPSSVDTSATHSSGEGDSPSTTATTDDGGDATACASPDSSSLSRGSTPGIEKLSGKRAASSDAMTMSMIRSPKRRSQSRSPELDAAAQSQPGEGDAQDAATTSADAKAQDGQAVYEIIKRGRGRPRKDGLPNKSTIAIKRRVPTAREKRDAAQARKRERQLEKVGRTRATSRASGSEAAPTNTGPSAAEVCGFRELKI
ncbi:OTU-like cysteine protease [Pseudozyma hubeiensis]|nr:OTU-like cysteine protease [Pseudozyma hubeiensis]